MKFREAKIVEVTVLFDTEEMADLWVRVPGGN